MARGISAFHGCACRHFTVALANDGCALARAAKAKGKAEVRRHILERHLNAPGAS